MSDSDNNSNNSSPSDNSGDSSFYDSSVSDYGDMAGYAAEYPLHSLVMERKNTIQELEFFNGIDQLNRIDCDNMTPLGLAIQSGNLAAVKFLCKNGANINYTSKGSSTPLVIAILMASCENFSCMDSSGDCRTITTMIECLIENGADVNAACGKYNELPLHYACKTRCEVEIINILHEAGASVNQTNALGETPLYSCIKFVELSFGSSECLLKIVKYLVEKGADLEIPNVAGETPLYCAAGSISSDTLDQVKLLIELGANINTVNYNGDTCLCAAARNGKLENLKYLISLGDMDIEKGSENGTPLHMACTGVHSNYFEIVKILVANKANFLKRNGHGFSPLEIASLQHNPNIKEFLINHPWYRRRNLIIMRPYDDHETNKEHKLLALGKILTATSSKLKKQKQKQQIDDESSLRTITLGELEPDKGSNGEDELLFQLKIRVACYL